MKRHLTSMTAGLAVGITLAVVVACAAGAWFYSTHHFRTLIANERSMALAQGEIMRAALEHQMMENDRRPRQPRPDQLQELGFGPKE